MHSDQTHSQMRWKRVFMLGPPIKVKAVSIRQTCKWCGHRESRSLACCHLTAALNSALFGPSLNLHLIRNVNTPLVLGA
jgi:hypothetical protein